MAYNTGMNNIKNTAVGIVGNVAEKVISFLPRQFQLPAALFVSALGLSALAGCGGARTNEQPAPQPTIQIVTPTPENRFANIDPKSEAGQALFFALMEGCQIVAEPIDENANVKVIKYGFAVVHDRRTYSETTAQLVEGPVAAQDIAPESLAGLQIPGDTVSAMMLAAIARDQTRQEIYGVSTQLPAVRRYVPNTGVPFSEAPMNTAYLMLDPEAKGYLKGFYLEIDGTGKHKYNLAGAVSYTVLGIVPTAESTADCEFSPQEVLEAARLTGGGL